MLFVPLFYFQELLTKTVSVKCPADISNIWKWLRLYQDHTKTTYSNYSTRPGLSDRAWVLDKVNTSWKYELCTSDGMHCMIGETGEMKWAIILVNF